MERSRGPYRIAADSVQHALWTAGAAAGVEDEQRVLGIHRFAGAIWADLHVVIPVITAFGHRHRFAGVLHYQYGLNTRGLHKRSVDIGFQRNRFAAAQSAVGTHHKAAAAIIDPASDCLR